MHPAVDIRVLKQQVEQAKAQRDQIQSRVDVTKACIDVLVESGKSPNASTEPLIEALCRVQLAQLRMAAQEGETALAGLNEFIKHNETPLFGASLIPPTGRPRH